MNKVKKNIIWLASYPKSGNTWFRVFLSNLMLKKEKAVNINELYNTPIASSRLIFDNISAVMSSELNFDEIDVLRPQVFRELSKENSETVFHKIHDAYTNNIEDKPIFPPAVTKGAIYFIRNPLDVAISYAHHSAITIDKSVKSLTNEKHALCAGEKKLANQLRQRLLKWEQHVYSWLNNKYFPVHIVKYEDMKLNTFNTFKKAVKFADLNYSDEDIKKALEKSSFEELKRQEDEAGFKEKALKSEKFFRKGEIGEWENTLTKEQIDKITKANEKAMEQFGYLPK